MPRVKRNDIEDDEDKKDVFDIISEGIQRFCSIPGCRPKFHLDEARSIVEELRRHDLLKEGN